MCNFIGVWDQFHFLKEFGDAKVYKSTLDYKTQLRLQPWKMLFWLHLVHRYIIDNKFWVIALSCCESGLEKPKFTPFLAFLILQFLPIALNLCKN